MRNVEKKLEDVAVQCWQASNVFECEFECLPDQGERETHRFPPLTRSERNPRDQKLVGRDYSRCAKRSDHPGARTRIVIAHVLFQPLFLFREHLRSRDGEHHGERVAEIR